MPHLGTKKEVARRRAEYYQRNKERDRAKRNLYARRYRAKHKERMHKKWRREDLQRHYGLTTEDFEAMLLRQNNTCAICPDDISGKGQACVDHNHKTNKVRELLCHACNHGIGKLKDDPEILLRAVAYLKKHS